MRYRISATVIAMMSVGLWACSSSSGNSTGSGGAGATSGSTTTTTSTTATSGTGGGSGGGGAGTGGGTTGTGGGPSFKGYTRVDSGTAAAMPGSADVAIAPGGAIYVSWVVEQNGGRDVYVARSTDGGMSFGAAVKLDDAAIVPLVSMARHPYVEADDERVAVTFNDQAGTVYLYVAPATDPLSFGKPITLGADITTSFRDFPKPLFVGGKLFVAWQGYPASGARIYVSRETAGYASEEASGGAPGVPCECCPLDLLDHGGNVVVAFRNNDSNIREMWSAEAPSTQAFSKWLAISTSEGTIPACPMQGPRLGRTTAGAELAVWSVRGSQKAGSVYLSQRDSAGVPWSGGASLAGFVADEPTIAVTASGRIFVTGVTGKDKSSMLTSDNGTTWSAPEPLQAPDGSLSTPQAQATGDVAALAGVTAAGSVWLRRMQ